MEKYLTFEDFMEFIDEMSYSQGFYGRLKHGILELEGEELEELKKTIEAQNFKSTLDIVFWLEC